MYSNWISHFASGGEWLTQSESVLKRLPISSESASYIVALVVQPLASNLSNPSASLSKPMDDHHISWCMEVIGYGLGLPLAEHETIRDCVHIYCEWLTVLLPQPKASVPLPLLRIPNHYSRKIIGQLYHLFLPRPKEEGSDLINRQAVLCHRVLRTIQLIATHSVVIDSDTWESLLILLLAINDVLIPSSMASSEVGDHLCDRVLSALFDVWLHACAKSFPSPRLWKSLTSLAKEWRQKPTLISHWNRICSHLTSKLLTELCGFKNLELLSSSNYDDKEVPSDLSGELLAQTWFRFLHCIGNPIQLMAQNSSANKVFRHSVLETSQSVALSVSPSILTEFMKGISSLADIILNKPPKRDPVLRDQYIPCRARCNTVLHLFGSWLFQAALLDADCNSSHSSSSPLAIDRSRASSVSISSEPSMVMSRPRSATAIETSESTTSLFPSHGYDNGRAQAIGTLCRIICSKKSDEEILPLYIARFFVALYSGLKLREEKSVSEVIACVFLNSPSLFRINLDGVLSVLPVTVEALEGVLLPKDIKLKSSINRTEIRRAAIHQLLGLLCVPQHYWHLSVKDFFGVNAEGVHSNFIHLRPRLMNLLLSALHNEVDPLNLHLLLGGLGSVIEDVSAFEHLDPIPASHSHPILPHSVSGADVSSNVYSSVSDAQSWHSSTTYSYPSLSETPHYANDCDPLSSSFLSSVASAAIGLLSNKLLTLWKSDLNVSIAALEVLASMSKIAFVSANESHRVVCLLCEYILVQCSRPPPAHSKDLHSTIVAAFNCCGSWLSAHPSLATETDCLLACLQVIELGISGTISQPTKSGEFRKKKHEKDLKPVSLRVRDAAESLLTSMLEIFGNSSQHIKSEKYSYLLKVREKLSWCQEGLDSSHSEDKSPYTYFASTDGTILLSVKNESTSKQSNQEPLVTLRLRNPFAQQQWVSQMRHLPRHKSGMHVQTSNPGHPLPMNDLAKDQFKPFECFPESIERARNCLADKSLPSLDSISGAYDEGGNELEIIGSLINYADESVFIENDSRSEKSDWRTTSGPDSSRSARLFLSHLGLLRLGVQDENECHDGMFVGLDSSSTNFLRDLNDLDVSGPRSHDTVFVYYVKAGQKFLNEILSNSLPSIKDLRFSEFVRALGWPCDHTNSSIGDIFQKFSDASNDSTGLNSQSYFWSDGLCDITFILRYFDRQNTEASNLFQSNSYLRQHVDNTPSESSSGQPKRTRQSSLLPNPEIKTVVIWLECFEDLDNLPIDEVLEASYTCDQESSKKDELHKDYYLIFIHPLASGLFRIHLQHGSISRIHVATPLVDGAVVSQRTLGLLVRQTCINIGKRRRLDYENLQLPHVRRKMRIADVVSRYRTHLQPSSLITHMFSQL